MVTEQLSADSDDVPTCEIDHSMGTLKPKLVEWTWHSWSQLRLRTGMILKGWAKIGLDAIFKPERQIAALLRMATRGISIDDAPDGRVEDAPMSAADGLEGQAEEEECDADNAVEEDEEEVDMDVSIVACLENTAVVQGARRSSRLAARGDVLRDARMAQLIQEQTYVDGCADD
jgi:hypothetical protein